MSKKWLIAVIICIVIIGIGFGTMIYGIVKYNEVKAKKTQLEGDVHAIYKMFTDSGQIIDDWTIVNVVDKSFFPDDTVGLTKNEAFTPICQVYIMEAEDFKYWQEYIITIFHEFVHVADIQDFSGSMSSESETNRIAVSLALMSGVDRYVEAAMWYNTLNDLGMLQEEYSYANI